jgi:hypothetical protein
MSDFSRFSRTEMIIVEGNETFGRWKSFSFLKERPADNNIGVFQVTSAVEGRPDLISQQIYGTPLLDWVLIAFNNARAAINWPRTGDLVEYPVESIVVPEIL